MNNLEYTQDDLYYPDYGVQLAGKRGALFTFLFIAPLIISSISVAALPGFNYLVVGLGLIGTAAFFLTSFSEGFHLPKEGIAFVAFLCWSFTGFFVAPIVSVYLTTLFTMFKFLVFFLIIAHFARNRATISVMFFALLIGSAIVAVSAYLSGDYVRAEVYGERIAGTALNANVFAMTLVYATLVLLYFFKIWKSLILKIGIIGILLILARLIIASGSRKGFISFMMVLFFWYFFAYKKEILRNPLRPILAGLAILVVIVFLYRNLAYTLMAERMQRFLETLQAGGVGVETSSVATRLSMIRRGLKIIAANPLFGIGLNQYRVVSGFGSYAHNNYIEMFSNTGLVGGIIYYSIFVVLWLRLRRLSKIPLEKYELEIVNISKVFIVIRFVVDLVAVSYYSKINWILIAMLVGFTYYLERRALRLQTDEDYHQTEYLYTQSESSAYV